MGRHSSSPPTTPPSEAFALYENTPARVPLTGATYGLGFCNGLVLWTTDALQVYQTLGLFKWGFTAEVVVEVAEVEENIRATIVKAMVSPPRNLGLARSTVPR